MAKRKKSKITVPNDGTGKAKLVAFRPAKELGRLLDKVPDKTKAIEDALRLFFSSEHLMTCPTCGGAGKIMKVKP